jgi:hypothetical protein
LSRDFPAFLLGPSRTLIDPGAQQTDFSRRELISDWRHDLSFLSAGHQKNEPAPPTVASLNHGSAIATPHCVAPPVEAKSVHLLCRAVAGLAALKDRRNLPLEIDAGLGWGRKLGLSRDQPP